MIPAGEKPDKPVWNHGLLMVIVCLYVIPV